MILDRVELLDLVSENVALKRRGSRWVGLCPFHSEKTPSFNVTPEKGRYKCFGCGRGGDVFTYVQERENVSFPEAMRILADRAGIELTGRSGSKPQGSGRVEIARLNEWAVRFFREGLADESIGVPARAFLRERSLGDEVAEAFGVGYAGDDRRPIEPAAERAGYHAPLPFDADLLRRSDSGDTYDTFRERLIFPVRDATGRVVGFGGRTLIDHKAKYLNTRQNDLFDKSRNLFGIERARATMQQRNRAILVEGYTDCLAAHQAGFTETVATCGTAFTEAQVELIRRYCAEVVLLFDSDAAGEKAADRALQLAAPRHLAVRLARLPDGQDPCDYLAANPPERFGEVIDAATEALEFKWLQLKTRFGAEKSDAAKHEAVLQFIRFVGEISSSGSMDAIQRGLIANRVAALLTMEPGEVHEIMNGVARRRSGRDRSEPPEADSAPAGAFLQDAWSILLGVLLNEPGHCADVQVDLDSSLIRDERDPHIAGIVFSLAETLGEFTVKDVVSACGEDPAIATRIAELTERGALRGNYAATVQGALERIHRGSKRQGSESAKEDWRGADDPEQARSAFARFAQLSKEHRGYVPKRMTGPRAVAQHAERPPQPEESVPTETT